MRPLHLRSRQTVLQLYHRMRQSVLRLRG
jgi:hypothetical protein